VSFSGHQVNQSVKIEWSTATEINNAFFDVERSADQNNFISVGKIPSKGNSQLLQAYQHTDANVPAGTVYYRLKQVDTDGTISYSNIIAVNVGGKPANPVDLTCTFDTENLIVFIKSDEARSIKLEIYDATGKTVLNKNYTLIEGSNKVTLPANSMPSSSYVIRVGDVKNAAFSSSVVAVKGR
jgi:hypothetical protein